MALVAAAAVWSIVSRYIPASIEYRGEEIRLSRYYLSYEDYEEDPENIASSENQKVERLVASAPIARAFPTSRAMVDAVFAVRFPGYGLSSFGDEQLADGTTLAGFSVEIPRAGKDRVLVFQGREGAYVLVDDFVASGAPSIMDVALEQGRLVYSTLQGVRVLERPLVSLQEAR